MPTKKPIPKLAAPWEITDSMFLSEDEVNRLLDHVRGMEKDANADHRQRATVDRLIIEILLFSGIRNSELCQLRICDTAAEHKQTLLQITEGSKQGRSVFIPGKLSREIVDFVRGDRCNIVEARNTSGDVPQTLILNERGRPYDRTALYRRVVRILKSAGLHDRASVQLLRHTYGFLAYKRTRGNLLFVQQQLGHSHPMVTAIYAQFVEFSYSDLADDIGTSVIQSSQPKVQKPVKTPHKRKAKQ